MAIRIADAPLKATIKDLISVIARSHDIATILDRINPGFIRFCAVTEWLAHDIPSVPRGTLLVLDYLVRINDLDLRRLDLLRRLWFIADHLVFFVHALNRRCDRWQVRAIEQAL